MEFFLLVRYMYNEIVCFKKKRLFWRGGINKKGWGIFFFMLMEVCGEGECIWVLELIKIYI